MAISYFIVYPREVERHRHEGYELIVFEEPSGFWCPALIFGSIMDCAQVRVELRDQAGRKTSAVISRGLDVSSDALPLEIQWNENSVAITPFDAPRATTQIAYIATE